MDPEPRRDPKVYLASLPFRERALIGLAVRGWSARELARIGQRPEDEIRSVLDSIIQNLGTTTREELSAIVRAAGH